MKLASVDESTPSTPATVNTRRSATTTSTGYFHVMNRAHAAHGVSDHVDPAPGEHPFTVVRAAPADPLAKEGDHEQRQHQLELVQALLPLGLGLAVGRCRRARVVVERRVVARERRRVVERRLRRRVRRRRRRGRVHRARGGRKRRGWGAAACSRHCCCCC